MNYIIRQFKSIDTIIISIYVIIALLGVAINFNTVILVNIGILLGIGSYFLIRNNVLLLEITLVFTFFYKMLISEFGFPNIIEYGTDYLVLLMMVNMIISFKNNREKYNNKYLFFILCILFLNIISFIMNNYAFPSFLWGIRNNYKVMIMLFFSLSININDIRLKRIFNLITSVFSLQVIFTIYQYNKGYLMDNIAGTFGDFGTGNLCVFLAVFVSLIVGKYKLKMQRSSTSIFMIVLTFIPIVLGEIKIGFILIPIIVASLLVIYKIDFQSISIIILVIVFSVVSFGYFAKIYPGFSNFFVKDNIVKYNSSSYGGESLSRNEALGYISKNALVTFDKKMLGIGIGNGAPNKYEYFQGDYYKNNKKLKYEWFFLPYYTLENGYVGVILFLILIFNVYIDAIKVLRKCKSNQKKLLGFITIGITIIMISFVGYNNSMLSDTVGLLFFMFCGLTINAKNEMSSKENSEICI